MQIQIKNLRLRAVIGVNPWERTEPQAVILNIRVEFDGTKAAASDCIEDTVDYRQIAARVTRLVESSQFQLLETLAEGVLDVVMECNLVTAATVEIDKPHALKSADSTAVLSSRVRA